ncbi:MAG: hypothetical protein U1C71_00300, partial [archaeon]|nr:hypothetical protein [archaeon]
AAPTTKEIQQFILDKTGEAISEKLLRYHLKRLLDSRLLVREKQHYRFNPAPDAEPLDVVASYNYWISRGVISSTQNIENALEELRKTYL